MKAVIDGVVVAEAAQDDLISIEGNWYFPPSAITAGVLDTSPTPYTCPWKGACQYFNVSTSVGKHSDAAWSYPVLFPTAVARVGKDFANYVAFARSVTVS